MKDETTMTLSTLVSCVEEMIIREFKSKPQYSKRTSYGISKSLDMDMGLVEFILEESFAFELVRGCKGTMWTLNLGDEDE